MIRRGARKRTEADALAGDARAHDRPDPTNTGLWIGAGLQAVPLLGVLFLHWSLFGVMLIYWMEMGLIILSAMARICWCGATPVRNTVAMLLFSPIYFGPALGFVFAFFMAVVTFFSGPEVIEKAQDMPSMAEVGARILAEWLWVPPLMLVIGHVRDFAVDWIGSGAYRTGSMLWEMMRLYGTVILMIVVLILAAALLIDTGLGSVAVAFVVLVRIGLEVAFHFIARASHHSPLLRSVRSFLN